jgi:hypothetical protein
MAATVAFVKTVEAKAFVSMAEFSTIAQTAKQVAIPAAMPDPSQSSLSPSTASSLWQSAGALN